ncbi:MAG: hypothetical protein AAFY10_09610 [Pseudomonadota bacterium]
MAFENATLILFGVYCLGGGMAMSFNPPRMQRLVDNFSDTPALSYLTGAIMAPIGGGLLLAVHDFDTLRRGLVTLLGGAMLLEGWLMMVVPRTLLSATKPLIGNGALMRAYGVFALAIGVALLWLGHS